MGPLVLPNDLSISCKLGHWAPARAPNHYIGGAARARSVAQPGTGPPLNAQLASCMDRLGSTTARI